MPSVGSVPEHPHDGAPTSASASAPQPDSELRHRPRRPSATEALLQTARAAEAKLEAALLLLWDDLPAWRQDNHFIRSGYRPTSNSLARSVASLWYLHNESVNIWTHLVGAAAFAAGGLYYLQHVLIAPRYASASAADVRAFACFFAGAMLCLAMSATFHTLCNHSPGVAMWGNKLDYTGIVFLIVGSYVPALYYGFFCHPWLMAVYLGTVSANLRVFRQGQQHPDTD